MKIRIQDSSVRFRLTLREVEELTAVGKLERVTIAPKGDGGMQEFRYALEVLREGTSRIAIQGPSICFLLSPEDAASLAEPAREGVYLRQIWSSPDGQESRFMAFVEKDRPGSTCAKPEAWIYDAPHGAPLVTRPIPQQVVTA